jgi:hypothetical protein
MCETGKGREGGEAGGIEGGMETNETIKKN